MLLPLSEPYLVNHLLCYLVREFRKP